MADFTNRSPYVVSVARHPKLKRTFAFSRKDQTQQYINNLREQGLEPTVEQGDTSWLVRVRREGRKDQSKTFKSLKEAEAFVATVEAEERQGLFRDYTKGARTTTADLIRAYVEEDCPGLKGGDTYAYILNAMVGIPTVLALALAGVVRLEDFILPAPGPLDERVSKDIEQMRHDPLFASFVPKSLDTAGAELKLFIAFLYRQAGGIPSTTPRGQPWLTGLHQATLALRELKTGGTSVTGPLSIF